MQNSIKKIFTFTFITLVFILMFYIFYDSAFLVPGRGISDLRCHIRIAENIRDFNYVAPACTFAPPYKLYHFITTLLSFLTGKNYELASAILLTFSQIMSFIITICIFNFELKNKKSEYFIACMSIITLIIISLPYKFYMYLPQGSPNVWHNPTFVVMKPFALVSFYTFYKIIEDKKVIDEKLLYGLFCFSTLVSTLAKPSFVLTFLPAAGLIVLFLLIKNKFRNIIFGFKMLFSVLPTLVVLIAQFLFIRQFQILDTSIVFGTFLELGFFNSILSTLVAILFPFFVTVMTFRYTEYKYILMLGWANLSVGWFQYYFLIQKASPTGDFAWGYMFGLYLLYLFSILALLRVNIKELSFNFKIIFIISTVLLITQVLLGFYYFYIVFSRFNFIFPKVFDINNITFK